MELESTEYVARVNDLNQVTVPTFIRDRFGISAKDEIVLEFKGKVKQDRIEPKEIKRTVDYKKAK